MWSFASALVFVSILLRHKTAVCTKCQHHLPCRLTMYNSGNLLSPNYPANYPAGLDYEWYLHSTTERVRIQFTFFETMANYDEVHIYDGYRYNSDNLIARLSGRLNASESSPLTYQTTYYSSMMVTFTSELSMWNRGFRGFRGFTSEFWSLADSQNDTRLVNRSGISDGNLTAGRVEVQINGFWRSVYTHGPGEAAAEVVCRSLRFGSVGRVISHPYWFAENRERPITVECNGNETSLSACRWRRYYDHPDYLDSKILWISCSKLTEITGWNITLVVVGTLVGVILLTALVWKCVQWYERHLQLQISGRIDDIRTNLPRNVQAIAGRIRRQTNSFRTVLTDDTGRDRFRFSLTVFGINYGVRRHSNEDNCAGEQMMSEPPLPSYEDYVRVEEQDPPPPYDEHV